MGCEVAPPGSTVDPPSTALGIAEPRVVGLTSAPGFVATGQGWSARHAAFDVRSDGDRFSVVPRGRALKTARALGKQPAAISFAWAPAGPEPTRATKTKLRGDRSLAVERSDQITEELALSKRGLEQRWRVSSAPASGELVVQVRVDGYAFETATAAGLHFRDAGSGARVRYGAATWVDAAKRRTPIKGMWVEDRIELRVPREVLDASTYPAVLDPLIEAERGVDIGLPDGGQYDSPAVAAGTDNYLVAWLGTPLGDGKIPLYAARVRGSDGTVEDTTPIQLAENISADYTPTIAFDGARYFVTWLSRSDDLTSGQIRANRIDASTGALELSQPLLVAEGYHYGLVVGFAAGHYVLAMTDGSCNMKTIRIRAGDLAVLAPTTLVPVIPQPFTCNLPSSLVVADDGFALSVSRYIEVDDDHEVTEAWAYRLTSTGSNRDPDGIPLASSLENLVKPSVVANDGAHLIYTWEENVVQPDSSFVTHLYAGRIDSGSGAVFSPLPLDFATLGACSAYPSQPAAAFSGASTWVAWFGCDDSGLHLTTLPRDSASATNALVAENVVNPDFWNEAPALASKGTGQALLVYERGETGSAEYSILTRLIKEPTPPDGGVDAGFYIDAGAGAPDGGSTSGPATVTTNQQSYAVGATVSVSFAGLPGNSSDWIAIAEDGTSVHDYVKFLYTGGTKSGTLQFTGLSGGTYRARAFSAGGYALVASSTAFTVASAGPASVSTSASSYAAADTIVVSFANLAGYATDWVGIAQDGTPNAAYLRFAYTAGATNGSLSFAGLSGGTYRARVFRNNGYTLQAESAPFTVVSTAGPTVSATANSYAAGATATASFTNLAGYAHDWVAVAQVGAPLSSYVHYAYTNGATSGTLPFTGLTGGTYVFRAFLNDSYTLEAESQPFTVGQGAVATLSSDRSTYAAGDPVIVSYAGLVGYATDWIAITEDGAPLTSYVRYVYTGGASAGTASFTGLTSGTYRARAFLNNGYTLEAESATFTVDAGTTPSVTTNASSYPVNPTVVVQFQGLPGYAGDWIAVAEDGAPPTRVVKWAYTGGAHTGTLSFTGLAGASYRARAFRDNGYELLAESPAFTVASNVGRQIGTDALTYAAGATVGVLYTELIGYSNDWIAIAPDGAPLTSYVAWAYTGGNQTGGKAFSGLPAGTYRARAFAAGGFTLQAESGPFVVNALPITLTTDKTSYAEGDSIQVSYANVPRADRVVIALASAPPNQWTIELAVQPGEDATVTVPGPARGTYVVRVLTADAVNVVRESAAFLVHGACPTDCAPYRCDQQTGQCTNSCIAGPDCATGAQCTEEDQCVTVCVGNVCNCPAGQRFCAPVSTCVDSSACCADADCDAPPDLCHSATGSVCSDGVCRYPSVTCLATESCLQGACIPATLSLAVTPSAVQYTLGDDIFRDGTVHFSGVLSNLSTAPMAVASVDTTAISVRELRRNGVLVIPTVTTQAHHSDPLLEAEHSLTDVSQMSSTTVAISSLELINIHDSGQYMLPLYVPERGRYGVVFQYSYIGRSLGHPQVFRGVITSNEVSFEIQ